MMGRGRGLLALLLLFSCAVHRSQAQCITTFQAGLANATTETGFTILTAAITAIAGSSDAGIFPSAGDGVTLMAPDDVAFTNALTNSGLSLSTAETELGSKIISILLYHVLPQGAFTTSELVAAASVQSDLGAYLKANLPLTFASAAGAVNVSGVTGSSALGTPFQVCNSAVFPISTVLLPSTSISNVPDVLVAAGPAGAPAGSAQPPPAPASLLTPPPPSTQPPPPSILAAVVPALAAAAPVPSALAPVSAPLAGPAPVPAVAPVPAAVPVPASAPAVTPASAPIVSTPTATAPALVGGVGGLALAPAASPTSDAEQSSMLSIAAVLSSATAGALALLFL